ncbi:hypothetical protein ACN47E_007106 [Coniothyrium glycines]
MYAANSLPTIKQPPSAYISVHLRWSSGHDFRLSLPACKNCIAVEKRGRPGFDSPSESQMTKIFFLGGYMLVEAYLLSLFCCY